jgi:hypothetical protein
MQGVIDRSDLPISIHSKVDDERISAVECEQLVLAATFYSFDSLPFRAPCTRRWQLSLQGGMDGPHGSDRLSKRGATEEAGCGLYFGELRQARSSFRHSLACRLGVANGAAVGFERAQQLDPGKLPDIVSAHCGDLMIAHDCLVESFLQLQKLN